MASYKEIEGFSVQSLTADPDNTGAIGQIYYNSTTGSFKAVENGGAPAGTWASGGSFPTPAVERTGGAGTQTAAVSVAGYSTPTGALDGVYEYNGTSWSTNPNSYPTVNYGLWGSGTATAGLFTGGSTPTLTGATNKFNGTTFTSTGPLNTGRYYLASSGTENATLATGGYTTVSLANVEDFNGSTWSPTTSMNNVRNQHSQIGLSTAALALGKSPAAALVESWNGTSWTVSPTLNTQKQTTGASGTQTYGLIYAGEYTAPLAQTESWDGTAWTEVADLSTAGYGVGSLGVSAPAALTVTWSGNGRGTATEEWNAPDIVIKTLTTS